MKDSPTPPPAPNPQETAGAQTQSNIQTAIANARLNRVNQSTPWGSINYTPGEPDANGVPSYSSNIQLSPSQQHLLEQQEGMSTSRNDIAARLLGQTGSALGQPLNLSGAHQVYDRYAPQGASTPQRPMGSPAATPQGVPGAMGAPTGNPLMPTPQMGNPAARPMGQQPPPTMPPAPPMAGGGLGGKGAAFQPATPGAAPGAVPGGGGPGAPNVGGLQERLAEILRATRGA